MLKKILSSASPLPVSALEHPFHHTECDICLLKTGALQKAILCSANFACIATDAGGVIQIFNLGAERLLGYQSTDVINKLTPADISDPDEIIARALSLSIEFDMTIHPGFEALVFKASRGIEDIYELSYLRQDGGLIPVILSVTALRDIDETIIGYLLIGTDNAAHKQSEAEHVKLDQKLHDQQFYTRSLVESNIDALMATNPNGILTDVNQQMEHLTGCTRNELIGSPFKQHFTDPDRAETGIKRVLNEKHLRNYELTVLARDGREVVVSCNASTFYNRERILQGVFASARDVTERKLAEAEIVKYAFHDTLTGLPNRRLLNERLTQAMARSKRNTRYGALVFLDLDNFKSLNDTHGHNVGDTLLIEVAHRISHCVREVDFVARFGGDEFVVILGELNPDKASATTESHIIAEKIRALLLLPYELTIKPEGEPEMPLTHHCSASLGVALFLDHEVGTDDVIKWADIAMYQAKQAGGNTVCYYKENNPNSLLRTKQ
jgi:diguanylate cyclase (GGDEF)-like protein/PAS domain S-box-containing protein